MGWKRKRREGKGKPKGEKERKEGGRKDSAPREIKKRRRLPVA